MRRETAVAGIAGEDRPVAKVFRAGAAVGAGAASMAEPRHANAPPEAVLIDADAKRIDDANNLVARYKWQLRVLQLTVDDVQVGSAHSARFHTKPDFTFTGQRIRALDHFERNSRLLQNHGLHGFLLTAECIKRMRRKITSASPTSSYGHPVSRA